MLDTSRWAFGGVALFIVAALLVALGYRVWRDRPARDVNRWFAFQALVLASWVAGVGATYSGVLVSACLRWTFASAALLPLAFVGFVRVFPDRTALVGKWSWVSVASASIVLSFLSMATPWVIHTVSLTSDGRLQRLTGPLYPVHAAFLVIASTLAVAMQIARWRAARGRARLQLQYYVVGVLIAAVGWLTTTVAVPTITGRPTDSVLGPYFVLAFPALVAHSIVGHRVLDLRIVVSHGLTSAAAVVISLLPAGALCAIFWPALSSRVSREEVLLGVGAVFGVALLTPSIRDAAGQVLDRYVPRHRSNARRVLREASRALSDLLDLERVATTIVAAGVEMTRAGAASLYLGTDRGMRLVTSRIVPPIGFENPSDMPASVLRAVVAAPGEMIVTEELERTTSQDVARVDLEMVLRINGWSVAAPLRARGALVGVLVIGRTLSGEPLSAEDLDAISTLVSHAGSAVRNAQLYAEIAVAKNHFENIVSTISSGVIAVTSEGRITLFNPAAAQLSGIPQRQGEDGDIGVLPQSLRDALQAALASRERRTYPRIAISSVDQNRMAICTAAPLHNHVHELVGAVAVFSDLTSVQDLERERSRAERLAEFQLMTQALAHEIANPLSPLKTMTRLLHDRSADRRFIAEFQRIVTRELERIERLVSRLRTVGGPQRPVLGRVDLCKAVVAAFEVLAATAEERGIALGRDFPSEPIAVSGDQAELEEMFLNLVKNAIEAIPEHETAKATVSVAVMAVEGDAVVRVMDTGSGFSPALLDQVFVPFVTTKPRGSGLGLAICASVAQRSGGHIDVANGPDGGGIVTVRLPLL